MTRNVFTTRPEAERFAQQARENNTFVRMTERQTRVTNRAGRSPQAAQFRNRYVFTVTTSD